jgi:hypothetical protein
MNHDFAHHPQIPLQKLKEKQPVEVIDGRSIEFGDITHIAKVVLRIQ